MRRKGRCLDGEIMRLNCGGSGLWKVVAKGVRAFKKTANQHNLLRLIVVYINKKYFSIIYCQTF